MWRDRRNRSRGDLCFSFLFLSFLPCSLFPFPFPSSLSFHAPDLAFELLDTRKYAPRDAVKTETRRQKRRTSKHRKRRNRGGEEKIWARSSENVNSRAIAVRLHAKMNYNSNNNRSPLMSSSVSSGSKSNTSVTRIGSLLILPVPRQAL